MAHEATIYSAEGENLVTLSNVKKIGDQLVMQGSLMGAWSSTMYIPPESFVAGVKLFINRHLIYYMISLPFFIIRRRNKKGREMGL
jgi:hypothetical protein